MIFVFVLRLPSLPPSSSLFHIFLVFIHGHTSKVLSSLTITLNSHDHDHDKSQTKPKHLYYYHLTHDFFSYLYCYVMHLIANKSLLYFTFNYFLKYHLLVHISSILFFPSMTRTLVQLIVIVLNPNYTRLVNHLLSLRVCRDSPSQSIASDEISASH
jgi:hypothetical protein